MIGVQRLVAGSAGVIGDVLHSRRHLVDRGGGLVGFALLAEHALAHCAHALGHVAGTAVQLAGDLADGADHTLVAGLHGIERCGHLADFIGALQRYAQRQVAAALGLQHDVLEGIEVAQKKTDQQLRGGQQQQHQHRDCQGVGQGVLGEQVEITGGASADRQVASIAECDALGADHGRSAEPGVVLQCLPAAGIGCALRIGQTVALQHLDIGRAGQGRLLRPLLQQTGLLGGGLPGIGATGLLFGMQGEQHQHQADDEGNGVDRPEFVLERKVADPGAHAVVIRLAAFTVGYLPAVCRGKQSES